MLIKHHKDEVTAVKAAFQRGRQVRHSGPKDKIGLMMQTRLVCSSRTIISAV